MGNSTEHSYFMRKKIEKKKEIERMINGIKYTTNLEALLIKALKYYIIEKGYNIDESLDAISANLGLKVSIIKDIEYKDEKAIESFRMELATNVDGYCGLVVKPLYIEDYDHYFDNLHNQAMEMKDNARN